MRLLARRLPTRVELSRGNRHEGWVITTRESKRFVRRGSGFSNRSFLRVTYIHYPNFSFLLPRIVYLCHQLIHRLTHLTKLRIHKAHVKLTSRDIVAEHVSHLQ